MRLPRRVRRGPEFRCDPGPRVARAIGAACEQIGFFCITGHGVDAGLTDEVRRVARSFFRLPLAQKQAISRQPPRFRGYVGMGTEGLGRISGYGVADLKEAFSMGLVHRVLPGTALLPATLDYARHLIGSISPNSLRQTRWQTYRDLQRGLPAAVGDANDLLQVMTTEADYREAVMAFTQKRTPQWGG